MAEQENKLSTVLSQISMVTANYGEGVVLSDVIQDWFKFLGGKPGEVVVIDCGSDTATQTICWNMFQQGLIDKLQFIHPSSDDFGKEKGYIKEYTAGSLASKPYVLVYKTDTLPYQSGNEDWLIEAIEYLDRAEVFAVGGSYNLPYKHHDAWPGWYYSRKCSYNFALMKRDTFMACAHEFANDFILSGFKGENPAHKTNQDRYFIEVAFEQYMERHDLYTLMKVEEPNWTVFHTNLHDERLKQVRMQYLARTRVERYMNAGFSEKAPDPDKIVYYGYPSPSLIRRLRTSFGTTPLSIHWRALKQRASENLLAKRRGQRSNCEP